MNRTTKMAIVVFALNALAGIGGPKVMAQERLHGFDIANMKLNEHHIECEEQLVSAPTDREQ